MSQTINLLRTTALAGHKNVQKLPIRKLLHYHTNIYHISIMASLKHNEVFLICCNECIEFLLTEYLLECVNGIGMDYRGTKSKTKSGKACQRWEGTFPHVPKYISQFDFFIHNAIKEKTAIRNTKTTVVS